MKKISSLWRKQPSFEGPTKRARINQDSIEDNISYDSIPLDENNCKQKSQKSKNKKKSRFILAFLRKNGSENKKKSHQESVEDSEFAENNIKQNSFDSNEGHSQKRRSFLSINEQKEEPVEDYGSISLADKRKSKNKHKSKQKSFDSNEGHSKRFSFLSKNGSENKQKERQESEESISLAENNIKKNKHKKKESNKGHSQKRFSLLSKNGSENKQKERQESDESISLAENNIKKNKHKKKESNEGHSQKRLSLLSKNGSENKQKECQESVEDHESISLAENDSKQILNNKQQRKEKSFESNEEHLQKRRYLPNKRKSFESYERHSQKSRFLLNKQKSFEGNEGHSPKRHSFLLQEIRIDNSLRDDWKINVNTLRDNKGKRIFIDPERRYSEIQINKKNKTIWKLKDHVEILYGKAVQLQDECYHKDGRIQKLELFKYSYDMLQESLEEKNKYLDRERNKIFKLGKMVKEKEKLIGELEQVKNESQSLIKDRDKQIEQNQDLIKVKDERIEELEQVKNKTQDLIKVRDIQIEQNHDLIKVRDERIEELEQVKNKTQDLIKVRDIQIEQKQDLIKEKDVKIEALLKQQISTELEDLQKTLRKKEDEIIQLRRKNRSLMEENSEHQNYIGKALSFSLSDDDKNHSVQLVKDIESLQTLIMEYVGNLRPRVDVNLEEVDKLSSEYGCSIRITSKENNALIKAIIQRYVFQKISEEAENYFKNVNCSENKIYEATKCLLEMLSEFSAKRNGTNEIIQALPAKIRQQIYGLLGNLGFADVIEDENNNEKHEHGFIASMRDTINKSVNNLRKIKDPKKKNKHDDMADKLIREFIRIFWYRLNVQEPVAKYHWFLHNDKIDPNLMKGKWDNENDENNENDDNSDDNDDNDEDNHDLLVEICAFPLIVANYKEKDQKLYTHAKVNHQVRINGYT